MWINKNRIASSIVLNKYNKHIARAANVFRVVETNQTRNASMELTRYVMYKHLIIRKKVFLPKTNKAMNTIWPNRCFTCTNSQTPTPRSTTIFYSEQTLFAISISLAIIPITGGMNNILISFTNESSVSFRRVDWWAKYMVFKSCQ